MLRPHVSFTTRFICIKDVSQLYSGSKENSKPFAKESLTGKSYFSNRIYNQGYTISEIILFNKTFNTDVEAMKEAKDAGFIFPLVQMMGKEKSK